MRGNSMDARRMTDWGYQAPWWLPGGNVQTIWSALYARPALLASPVLRRERWVTPDGDFIDVDRSAARVIEAGQGSRPLLVLFHGLEGSSNSHYARAFSAVAAAHDWDFAVPHFRGCSGELNLAPRAYHSGDHEEIDWVLRRFKAEHPHRDVLAVGVSLGGNALLRWAAEWGREASRVVTGLAAVCAPLDLAASGANIDQGFNRWVYARMFLRTMVRKAEAKWRQFPGLFDLEAVRRANTLYAFDNVFTAPLHGFRDTDDYWLRAASKPRLADISVPALVVNARNDPFVPSHCLPMPDTVGSAVTLWQPHSGGHVGFPASVAGWGWPGHVQAMPEAVTAWLGQHMGGAGHG